MAGYLSSVSRGRHGSDVRTNIRATLLNYTDFKCGSTDAWGSQRPLSGDCHINSGLQQNYDAICCLYYVDICTEGAKAMWVKPQLLEVQCRGYHNDQSQYSLGDSLQEKT